MTTKAVPIITGFESLQRSADLKRKLAEMMLEQSIQQQQMTSPFQALGKIAQAFASNRLERQAGKIDDQINSQMQQKQLAAAATYQAIKDRPISERLDFISANPWVPDEIKQSVLAEAKTAGEQSQTWRAPVTMQGGQGRGLYSTNGQGQTRFLPGITQPDMKNINGVGVDNNAMLPGQILPQSPTDSVIRNAQGDFTLNTPAVMARSYEAGQMGAGGLHVPPRQDPGMAGFAPQMPQAPQAAQIPNIGMLSPTMQGPTPTGEGELPPVTPGNFPPVPADAAEFLKKNPYTANQFDTMFGPGASQKILGGANVPSGNPLAPGGY